MKDRYDTATQVEYIEWCPALCNRLSSGTVSNRSTPWRGGRVHIDCLHAKPSELRHSSDVATPALPKHKRKK